MTYRQETPDGAPRLEAFTVVYFGRRGGGARYTLELVNALEERGQLSRAYLSNANEILSEHAVPAARLRAVSTPARLTELVTRIPQLMRTLMTFGRDLLARQRDEWVLFPMVHPWHPVFIVLSRLFGRRVVFVIHDLHPHTGDGGMVMRSLLQTCMRLASVPVTLSGHVTQEMWAEYPSIARRAVQSRLGLFRLGGTQPVQRQLPQGRPVRLLFFGRISRYKGVQLLLDAFRILARRHDVVLRVVGDGDFSLYSTEGIPPERLRLEIGWIEESRIREVLTEADICVLPYTEATQSGVLSLTFATSLPVVTTPTTGFVEQLQHGGGILAPDFAPESLAATIERLLVSPELYEKVSSGATMAARHFEWDRIVDDLAADLARIPTPRSRPAPRTE